MDREADWIIKNLLTQDMHSGYIQEFSKNLFHKNLSTRVEELGNDSERAEQQELEHRDSNVELSPCYKLPS